MFVFKTLKWINLSQVIKIPTDECVGSLREQLETFRA
jgi:hypothetical protein